jgi:hypothetical protein
MNFELKPISADAVPEALQKVERYRLLNEPAEAQSICEDILRIEPDNQAALVMLILTITDQFGAGASAGEARELIPRLDTEYQRAYCSGIICERSAKVLMHKGIPGANFKAYEELEAAMHWFERAEQLRPPENDDAILRWNTCVRLLRNNPALQPRSEERFSEVLGE